MIKSELLKIAVVTKSAELARESDEIGLDMPLSDYVKEYTEQLEDGSYMIWLRMWLGCMIESGSKRAVEIMKDIIKYGLVLRAERRGCEYVSNT